jgi:UPF0755 protein
VSSSRWHLFHPANLAMVLAVVVLALVTRDLFYPLGFQSEEEVTVVVIRKGANVDDIAGQLEERGLIKSPFAFALLARSTGVDRNLQAGQYRLHRGESVLSILRKLNRGMTGLNLINIPEGLTYVDVGRLLQREELIEDAEEFIALCADTALINQFNVPGPTMEGYLFPSTYDMLPATPAEVILRRMVAETRRVLEEEFDRGTPVSHELSPHEVLTLASIVEAEAARADERERIAAVYLNRLRKGMRLQADPTVAYALGGYRARLFYSDLRVESPYNTYRNHGLPPGPIGNPGRAAIRAVLSPLPGSKELFFVARGDGSHIFNETGEAHESARRAIRARRLTAAEERRQAEATAEMDSTAAHLQLPAGRAGLAQLPDTTEAVVTEEAR